MRTTLSQHGALVAVSALFIGAAIVSITCSAQAEPAVYAAHGPPDESTDEEPDFMRPAAWVRGVVGLRVGQTSLPNSDGAPKGTSFSFSARNEGFLFRNGLTTYHDTHLALGGGGFGLDGILQGAFGLGVRIPVAETHGPIARVAFLGALRGNDAYYFSLLDAPQGQFGYQFLRGRVGFEVAATVGWAIAGRASVDGIERSRLGGLERGLMATLAVRHLEVSARACRVDLRDEARTLDVGQGSICANALALALCGDLAWMRYSTSLMPTQPEALYAGFTIGFATIAATKSGT